MQDEKEPPSQVDAQPDKPKKATSVGGGEKAAANDKPSEVDAKPEPEETPEDKKLPD
jgi:hypothetical protein